MSIKQIASGDFLQLRGQQPDLYVVDVRTAAEVKAAFLAGCEHIPLHEISESRLQASLAKHQCGSDAVVYVLCGSGQRAIKAAEQLAQMENSIVVVEGGLAALKDAGGIIEQGRGSIMSLERQVRIAAGCLVLLGVVLGTAVNVNFYALSGVVGAGLVFAGITDTCGMGMMLARMPWNK